MKAFAVAKWEYLEKVKSKAFIISLILMPTIMIAFAVLPTLLASRPDNSTKVIGIIDQSGKIAAPLEKLMTDRYKLPDGQPNYLFRTFAPSEGIDLSFIRNLADSLVASSELEGYVVIDQDIFKSDTLTKATVDYRSENVGNIRVTERLEQSLHDVITDWKLRAQGLDPSFLKKVTTSIDLKTIKLSRGSEEESGFEQVFFSAYIFMMMMFFLVMTSGQLLVRSMLEEKSNRVVEVLMSSCSARDLMMGKIIGLSCLGLTQIAIWGSIGIVLALKFSITTISVSSALLLFVYFVLGYLFYAGIFVAVGAPVSTEQEAQQITSYLVTLLVLPIAFAFMVLQEPNSLFVKILTFIPLTTPTMMALRIPIQMPSTIEIVVSIFILTVSAWMMMWLAGKIFRTTILLTGKRPSLRELITLIRTK